MKKRRIIIGSLLSIVVSLATTYMLSHKNDNFTSAPFNTAAPVNTSFNKEYILNQATKIEGIRDYKVPDVDSLFAWELHFKDISSDLKSSLKIEDEQGKALDLAIQKNNNTVIIIPPKDGYIKGAQYRLTIKEPLVLADEKFKDYRSIIFRIK